jgi:hypothetical protein
MDKKKDYAPIISLETMAQNQRQIHMAKAVIFIFAGLICGVLGLTGLYGLLFYIAVNVVSSVVFMAKMGFQTMKYTNSDPISFALSGILNHALSFIMWWTLAFALVYIY